MQSRAVRVIAAFAVVYLVWGSTYLGIRIAVESIPPALTASLRFLAAGLLMLAVAAARGYRLPKSPGDWRTVTLTGILMLAIGNGVVTWAEQWVESNQAALIVATAALWIACFGTLGAKGQTLGWRRIGGLLLGFAGVAVLVSGGLMAHRAPWYAYAGLQLSALTWAAGSVYSKRNPVAVPPLMTAALQTLVAGLVLLAASLLAGEKMSFDWSLRSSAALLYLVVFGSCIAYVTYFWLVHEVTPAQLATYAYVNPAIAVLLGWWLLDESMTSAQGLGTLIILVSVIVVSLPDRQAALPATLRS